MWDTTTLPPHLLRTPQLYTGALRSHQHRPDFLRHGTNHNRACGFLLKKVARTCSTPRTSTGNPGYVGRKRWAKPFDSLSFQIYDLFLFSTRLCWPQLNGRRNTRSLSPHQTTGAPLRLPRVKHLFFPRYPPHPSRLFAKGGIADLALQPHTEIRCLPWKTWLLRLGPTWRSNPGLKIETWATHSMSEVAV
jgi:hypothetical protein